MIEELENIDTSLVDKVMDRNFNGGRYQLRFSEWRYALDKTLMHPVGIVERSIEAIPKPFFVCHLHARTSTITARDVKELHHWCLAFGGFYPVFVWRAGAAIGVDRQYTESYILVPKETDAVVLQAHLSA